MKILLAILISCISADAATYNAASTAYADVSAAVGLAANGDTVTVPSGTNTWGSTLTLNKSINLIGSGTNTTRILGLNLVWINVLNVNSNIGFRISSMTFSNLAGNAANPSTAAIFVNGPILNYRIDHCLFYAMTTPIHLKNRTEGVVDHNTTVNCEESILIQGGDDGPFVWSRPLGVGTTNQNVIESNTFYLDDNFLGPSGRDHNQDIYLYEGTKATTRYNTWLHDNYTGIDSFWDSHGTKLSVSAYAQPLVEMYKNTINARNSIVYSNSGADSRGGSGLFWSNTWFLASSHVANTTFCLVEEGISGIPVPSQYSVKNTFLWGNTHNGTAITDVKVNDAVGGVIVQNSEYWMSSPNSSNGNPSGIYENYQPLIFPHPRVTAEDNPNPSPQPAAPTNLRLIP